MAHFIGAPVQIANLALSHIGDSQIEALDQRPSAEAAQCRLWYDFSRQEILEAFDWGFARKRVNLALHPDTISETATDPMAGVWAFRYQYPNECLVFRKIQNSAAPPGDASPFEIETGLDGLSKSILTDVEDAVGVFTFDQEATDMFSPLFILAFSHLLAHHIAFSLTGLRKIRTEEFQFYSTLVGSAAGADGNERVDPPPREAEWIRGRV